MRNVLAHAGRNGRRVVSAFIAAAFAQDDAEQAPAQWRRVADQLRPKVPKLAALMDNAEPDVLAYMSFPAQHRVKLHSTNPLERLNGEIKRRTDVVGILPNEDAIARLVGAILLEQNDEWVVQRARYITLESIAPISHQCLRRAAKRRRPIDLANPRKRCASAATYTTKWDTIPWHGEIASYGQMSDASPVRCQEVGFCARQNSSPALECRATGVQHRIRLRITCSACAILYA
jgi:hypothetical protein